MTNLLLEFDADINAVEAQARRPVDFCRKIPHFSADGHLLPEYAEEDGDAVFEGEVVEEDYYGEQGDGVQGEGAERPKRGLRDPKERRDTAEGINDVIAPAQLLNQVRREDIIL